VAELIDVVRGSDRLWLRVIECIVCGAGWLVRVLPPLVGA